MAQGTAPADLIVEIIAHRPNCCLDDLVTVCPELTWNQIFLEVDQLSRAGRLRLALIGPGCYAVEVPTTSVPCTPRSRPGLMPVQNPVEAAKPVITSSPVP